MAEQDGMFETIGRQLRILWDKYNVQDENTFVGEYSYWLEVDL